ncbi:MAG TPA: TIGR03118 family protein [Rhodopila sp.]
MRNHVQATPGTGAARSTCVAIVGLVASLCAGKAYAAAEFSQIDLISDGSVPAVQSPDPNLINPWGVSYSPTGPFWVSDNGSGVVTLYNGAGSKQSLFGGTVPQVTVATPPGQTPGTASPDGQVFNGSGGFNVSQTVGGVTKTGSSAFIFATEDGTISGWSPGVDQSHSVLAVDNSHGGTGAVYKGLAIATSGGQTMLYAANFRSGQIEVYNSSFQLTKTFTDPTVPAGYAPFNVQVLNGKLYVTYALQDNAKHDDVAGLGHGFVDQFNLDGTGMVRVASTGTLDSPWGLAIAPNSFGNLAGDLLVGNFGDGTIGAFNLSADTFVSDLLGPNGKPLAIGDLWALTPGNGGSAGSSDNIYFTAGVANESEGLFGLIATPEPASGALLVVGVGAIAALLRRRSTART